MSIHPSSIIHPSSKIDKSVEIGPFCTIGEDVEIASGTKIISHAVLKGPTKIGKNNLIYQFSTIGDDTPDKKFHGEKTRLEIGDGNIFREGVTIHRGTIQDNSVTSIGSNNLFMPFAHVAHVSMAHPTSNGLMNACENAIKKEKIEYQRGGTYVVMEGPQFSTLAEIGRASCRERV